MSVLSFIAFIAAIDQWKDRSCRQCEQPAIDCSCNCLFYRLCIYIPYSCRENNRLLIAWASEWKISWAANWTLIGSAAKIVSLFIAGTAMSLLCCERLGFPMNNEKARCSAARRRPVCGLNEDGVSSDRIVVWAGVSPPGHFTSADPWTWKGSDSHC